jgi:hypothetical protein
MQIYIHIRDKTQLIETLQRKATPYTRDPLKKLIVAALLE